MLRLYSILLEIREPNSEESKAVDMHLPGPQKPKPLAVKYPS